jgi:hypothetical protein
MNRDMGIMMFQIYTTKPERTSYNIYQSQSQVSHSQSRTQSAVAFDKSIERDRRFNL